MIMTKKKKENNQKKLVLFGVITIQFTFIIVAPSSTHCKLNRARDINNCFVITFFLFTAATVVAVFVVVVISM